jgi:hypothetical protein
MSPTREECKYNNIRINNIFLNLAKDLMEPDDNYTSNKNTIEKCPELLIKLNNVEVNALIDTGSEVCGISDCWFNANKEQLGRF